jgi:hypothetical protein
MSSATSMDDPENLLAHAAWLRRLASASRPGQCGRRRRLRRPARGRCQPVQERAARRRGRSGPAVDHQRRPAGVYHIWTGLFTGWARRWVNMAVSEAPADRRDATGRIELATVIVE